MIATTYEKIVSHILMLRDTVKLTQAAEELLINIRESKCLSSQPPIDGINSSYIKTAKKTLIAANILTQHLDGVLILSDKSFFNKERIIVRLSDSPLMSKLKLISENKSLAVYLAKNDCIEVLSRIYLGAQAPKTQANLLGLYYYFLSNSNYKTTYNDLIYLHKFAQRAVSILYTSPVFSRTTGNIKSSFYSQLRNITNASNGEGVVSFIKRKKNIWTVEEESE